MELSAKHKSVMPDEAITFLCLKAGQRVLDGTVGCGGHSELILNSILPGGLLIGIDQDRSSLQIAEKRLLRFNKQYTLVRDNFINADKILNNLGIDKIDAALFDLGISSFQLGCEGRGFSFNKDSILDMRMDPSCDLTAQTIVNQYKTADIEGILRDLGEERYFRRIAGFIVERRKKSPINTTTDLVNVIEDAVGRFYRSQKIHPATRTFQALRIAVNDELNNIDGLLTKISDFLGSGARLVVISFHSLEDRIVKNRFREMAKSGIGKVITKKPVRATSEEVRTNPRSRSAKLRVFEKE